jgi:hypothetical protein
LRTWGSRSSWPRRRPAPEPPRECGPEPRGDAVRADRLVSIRAASSRRPRSAGAYLGLAWCGSGSTPRPRRQRHSRPAFAGSGETSTQTPPPHRRQVRPASPRPRQRPIRRSRHRNGPRPAPRTPPDPARPPAGDGPLAACRGSGIFASTDNRPTRSEAKVRATTRRSPIPGAICDDDSAGMAPPR